jgi:polysaccharide biosynthesis protein PslH
MKRLLYACGQMPFPPDNGQKIAAINDIFFLSKYFYVDVISYIDQINASMKDEYLAALRERLPYATFDTPVPHHIVHQRSRLTKAVPFVRGTLEQIPYVVSKYISREYLNRVQERLATREYDLLYIENLAPSYLLRKLPSLLLNHIKLIYRAHDIFSETMTSYAKTLGTHPKRLAVALDAAVCDRYERAIWRRVDAILPVTRRLETMIAALEPTVAAKLLYLPIAVEPQPSSFTIANGRKRVLYIGTVHFPPNLHGLQWFLRECWPQVLAQHPDATLDIIGRGGEALQPVHRSVTIHDYVDDLTQAYAEADVFVVPLFASSGIRLKILDALNHGVPVVSTTPGYAGLELQPGIHINAGDDIQAFVAAINGLLGDADARRKLSYHGKQFLVDYHGPLIATQAVEQLSSLVQAPVQQLRAPSNTA